VISVTSTVGNGTTFSLEFARIEKPDAETVRAVS